MSKKFLDLFRERLSAQRKMNRKEIDINCGLERGRKLFTMKMGQRFNYFVQQKKNS